MHNYLINTRPFTVFHDLKTELTFEKEKNYLFDLSYLSVLDFIGEKSTEFLQGQVTCDIRQLTSSTMLDGAICNLKGRILTLFNAIQWQGLKIILPSDLLENTQNSLKNVATLSRVKLQENTQQAILGFYCQNPNDLTLPANTDNYVCIQWHDNIFLIIIDSMNKDSLCESFLNQDQYRGSLAWHALNLSYKYIDIYPETRGEFLPHRLDLHKSGYLHFDKGCYKGQEIIARTHYRATLKHELRLFIAKSNNDIASGKKILDETGQIEIGEVIDYAPMADGDVLIAASVLIARPDKLFCEDHAINCAVNALRK